jgi:2Fe-2S ferredoxin
MSIFGRKEKETATVIYVSPAGDAREIAVPVGDSVMEGAIKHGVNGIVAECGGACMCATCHVYVDETFLNRLDPMDATEDEMLTCTVSPRRPNSRLSCQIRVTQGLAGLIVRLPETQV